LLSSFEFLDVVIYVFQAGEAGVTATIPIGLAASVQSILNVEMEPELKMRLIRILKVHASYLYTDRPNTVQ